MLGSPLDSGNYDGRLRWSRRNSVQKAQDQRYGVLQSSSELGWSNLFAEHPSTVVKASERAFALNPPSAQGRLLALFGHGAMSGQSPLCAPKRIFANASILSVHALSASVLIESEPQRYRRTIEPVRPIS